MVTKEGRPIAPPTIAAVIRTADQPCEETTDVRVLIIVSVKRINAVDQVPDHEGRLMVLLGCAHNMMHQKGHRQIATGRALNR